jgi:hypothetical protein
MSIGSFDGFRRSNEHQEARVFAVHALRGLNMPSGYKTSIATSWDRMRGLRSVT